MFRVFEPSESSAATEVIGHGITARISVARGEILRQTGKMDRLEKLNTIARQ